MVSLPQPGYRRDQRYKSSSLNLANISLSLIKLSKHVFEYEYMCKTTDLTDSDNNKNIMFLPFFLLVSFEEFSDAVLLEISFVYFVRGNSVLLFNIVLMMERVKFSMKIVHNLGDVG